MSQACAKCEIYIALFFRSFINAEVCGAFLVYGVPTQTAAHFDLRWSVDFVRYAHGSIVFIGTIVISFHYLVLARRVHTFSRRGITAEIGIRFRNAPLFKIGNEVYRSFCFFTIRRVGFQPDWKHTEHVVLFFLRLSYLSLQLEKLLYSLMQSFLQFLLFTLETRSALSRR